MTIIFNGTNNSGTINTGDATADECMEACVAAMLAEGYNPYNIAGALRAMARKMDDVAKKESWAIHATAHTAESIARASVKAEAVALPTANAKTTRKTKDERPLTMNPARHVFESELRNIISAAKCGADIIVSKAADRLIEMARRVINEE